MVFTQMIELRGSRQCPACHGSRRGHGLAPARTRVPLGAPLPRESGPRPGGCRAVPAEDYDLWMRRLRGRSHPPHRTWGLLAASTRVRSRNASWRSADSWKNPEQAQAFAEAVGVS